MDFSAWQRVLDFFGRKRGIYQRCFNAPDGKAVMVDLWRFCRMVDSTYPEPDSNTNLALVLEGRRQVALRIQQYLHLSSEQLAEINTLAMNKELKQ